MKFDKKKRTSERRNDCAKGGTPEKKPVDDGCGEFSKFRISSKTAKKLRERDITHLFPIQALTFDHIYDGLDVIGQARTGTGKTLSFVLPLCERFRKEKLSKVHGRPPTVLTLAPTRELALQIHKEFESVKNKRLVTCCVYGGVAYESQESAMRSGVDIIVGTPGRIHDHMTQGTLDLSKVRHVVLDEADRMMDMGFQEKVEEILKKPFEQENKPQMLLLSATMPKWVQDASKKYMSKDKKIVDLVGDTASKAATTVETTVLSTHHAYHDKAPLY